MAKNETWHPLKPEDAYNLTTMIAQFNTRSPSGQKRVYMTLYLWSRLWDERDGTPYFRCSERTIAKECGVSYKTARSFMSSMEEDGWIVRLERHRRGKRITRTFAWLTDESAPQKGRTVRPNYLQKGRTSAPLGKEKRAHINMEHVNSAGNVTPAADATGDVPSDRLVNAVTGEPYETELRDPNDIRGPSWMKR